MTQPHDPLLAGASTIRGDLRDLILSNLSTQTKLWRDMPQADQEAMVRRIDAAAAEVVTRIAVLVATGGKPHVLATLENMSIGAECKAILTVPKDQAGALIMSTKQIVAVMQPGAVAFMGERKQAETMPDQLTLTAAANPEPAKPTADVAALIEKFARSSAERTTPETKATLLLQQKALIEGRRPCMMFPTGTEPLPLPAGMDTVTTGRGIFHFNPEEMDPVSIVAASDAGEENLLLGLGPYCKADVLKMAAEGNPVMCVVERAPDGTEVLAALTIEAWADEVQEIMERNAADGHTVEIETVEQVLAGRTPSPPKVIEVVVAGGGGGATVANTVTKGAGGQGARQAKRVKAKPKSRRKANGHDAGPKTAPPSKPTGSPFQ